MDVTPRRFQRYIKNQLKSPPNPTFPFHGSTVLVGLRLLTVEVSGSHSVTLLWTSDRPVAETYDNTQHSRKRGIHAPPPAGFEPAIPASDWLHTHALDGTATGIGRLAQIQNANMQLW